MIQFQLKEWNTVYENIMKQKDPRMDGYPMMDSPLPMIVTIILYLLVVRQGSRWMEARKPFELKRIIFVYNCLMVLISLYLFGWGLFAVYKFGYSMYCNQWIDYIYPDDFPYKKNALDATWLNFFSKVIELIDTVFFIMRKKFNQVTFLHVYHHALTLIIFWLGVRFLPGGPTLIAPLLNCFIHVIMYTYYALTSIGVNLDRWKKYLTLLQIAQFLVFIVNTILFTLCDCPFRQLFGFFCLAYVITLLLLFTNFYIQAYVKKSEKSTLSRSKDVARHKNK